MKKRITLVLALAAFAAMAQPYNRTYDVNANNDVLIPSFVIPSRQGGDITLSIGNNGAGLPRPDYFVLTKTRCDTSIVFNVIYYNPNTPNEGMTNVEALLETPQGNILIAGYHYDNINRIQQPMLIEVTNNGAFGWKRIYYDNQRDIVDAEINKISLCAVAGTPNEYMIVASSDSYNQQGVSVMTNVIKVDEFLQGAPIINRKYFFANNGVICKDYPGDIEYSPAANRYMITGYRAETDQSGAINHSMFFFSIDANLNVMAPGFRTFTYPSRPIDQDMVYDPATRNFAVTFTHDRNQFIPTMNSVMGFMRVDALINQVGPSRYYWHNAGTEHNARSISRSNTGEFIIGAGVFDPNIGTRNPSIFKVNNTGVPTTALTRYNVRDDVYFGHHNTTVDCFGNESYILANEHKTDLRLIFTDFNAVTCGAIRYDINVKDYVPSFKTYAYATKDYSDHKRVDLITKRFFPVYRDCFPPGNSYRPTAATAIAQLDNDGSTVAMYPTILSADNARLTMVNNSGAALKVELHNIAGQLIYSNTHVADGTSEVQLNSNGSLSEGIYLLKAYDAKGTLTATTKLLITK